MSIFDFNLRRDENVSTLSSNYKIQALKMPVFCDFSSD